MEIVDSINIVPALAANSSISIKNGLYVQSFVLCATEFRITGVIYRAAMAIRYEIRRKLENGDVLCVAECGDDRKRAEQLAQ